MLQGESAPKLADAHRFAFKKGVGAATDETAQTPPGQPGDAAKPISAQTTTTPPGGQVHQDSAAKV